MLNISPVYEIAYEFAEKLLPKIEIEFLKIEPELAPIFVEERGYFLSSSATYVNSRVKNPKRLDTIERLTRKILIKRIISSVINYAVKYDKNREFNIVPIIIDYIDDIYSLGLHYTIIEFYSPYRYDVSEAMCIALAGLLELDLSSIKNEINYLNEKYKDKKLVSAILVLYTFYFLNTADTITNIDEYLGYMATKIPTADLLIPLKLMNEELLICISLQLTLISIPFIIHAIIKYSDNELLNKLILLTYPDIYDLRTLDIMRLLKIIDDKMFLETVSYILYIFNIVKSYDHYLIYEKYVKFIKNIPEYLSLKRFKNIDLIYLYTIDILEKLKASIDFLSVKTSHIIRLHVEIETGLYNEIKKRLTVLEDLQKYIKKKTGSISKALEKEIKPLREYIKEAEESLIIQFKDYIMFHRFPLCNKQTLILEIIQHISNDENIFTGENI